MQEWELFVSQLITFDAADLLIQHVQQVQETHHWPIQAQKMFASGTITSHNG